VSRFVRRAAWIAPGLLFALAALVARDRLWVAEGVGGSPRLMNSPARVLLVSLPVFTVLYALTFTWLINTVWQGGRGLRQPSEAELGCAVLFMRGLLVACIYAFALFAWFV
jgi:hypothetical protein